MVWQTIVGRKREIVHGNQNEVKWSARNKVNWNGLDTPKFCKIVEIVPPNHCAKAWGMVHRNQKWGLDNGNSRGKPLCSSDSMKQIIVLWHCYNMWWTNGLQKPWTTKAVSMCTLCRHIVRDLSGIMSGFLLPTSRAAKPSTYGIILETMGLTCGSVSLRFWNNFPHGFLMHLFLSVGAEFLLFFILPLWLLFFVLKPGRV